MKNKQSQLSIFDVDEEEKIYLNTDENPEIEEEIVIDDKPIIESKNFITSKMIEELFGVKESFELPPILLEMLLNNEKQAKLFAKFKNYNLDEQADYFRDYFQSEHSARKELKQDYTPDCICNLISKLSPTTDEVLDVCSGTGSLSLTFNNLQTIYCEELSNRSIPFLLFNLSIHNVNGYVIQKDVITNEVQHIYELFKGDSYSLIKEVENIEKHQAKVIVSNPPYSLQWNPKYDERLGGGSPYRLKVKQIMFLFLILFIDYL